MRKPRFKHIKLFIAGRIPERPLTPTEADAAAQGHIPVKFTDAPHIVKWCGLRRHLTQAEFARQWQAMNAECEQLQRDNPGALFWPLEHGQDTHFFTGQTL